MINSRDTILYLYMLTTNINLKNNLHSRFSTNLDNVLQLIDQEGERWLTVFMVEVQTFQLMRHAPSKQIKMPWKSQKVEIELSIENFDLFSEEKSSIDRRNPFRGIGLKSSIIQRNCSLACPIILLKGKQFLGLVTITSTNRFAVEKLQNKHTKTLIVHHGKEVHFLCYW